MAEFMFRTDLTNDLVEVLMVLENALEHIDDESTTESVKTLLEGYYHDDYLAEMVLSKMKRDKYNERYREGWKEIAQASKSPFEMMEMLKTLNMKFAMETAAQMAEDEPVDEVDS